mmetsp:Transcript_5689/g.8741  ORF Transcript_5689/g.8741 Transcript_5689/m.8741 type:complete len:213 (-) Transcript_5689:41-679(-)
MTTTTNNNDNINFVKRESKDVYWKMAESIMRVSVAGFGGSLAGLSVSRIYKQRLRVVADGNLPLTWAMACMGFAGIVEFMKMISPTSYLVDATTTTTTAVDNNYNYNRYLTTVGDYTLGGALAGATFQGASIQTTETTKILTRRLQQQLPQIGIMVGFVPGTLLGLTAGLLLASLQYVEDQLDAEQQASSFEGRVSKDVAEGTSRAVESNSK